MKDGLARRPSSQQQVVDRDLRVIDSHGIRQIPLWVHVHEQHTGSGHFQPDAEVHGQAGLTHTAFLICKRNDLGHRTYLRKDFCLIKLSIVFRNAA